MHEFHFQTPGTSKFLEAVSQAAINSTGGLGVFAFASAGGVRNFLAAIGVGRAWAQPKVFHLIVGIDAITNADALLAIADGMNSSGGAFTAEVFLHGHPFSTFHPKFTLFSSPRQLRFLTGSGNLTTRGLGEASISAIPDGNWEAFAVQDFVGADAERHCQDALQWMENERNLGRLRRIDDPDVQARAMANSLLRFSAAPPLGSATGLGGAIVGGTGGGHWGASTQPGNVPILPMEQTPLDSQSLAGGDLLIKELPRNRPGQADVGKEILESFFGYNGYPRTILLQHVSLNNVVGQVEPINLFENESRNFRLELREIASFSYDIGVNDERIIVVVARLDDRAYRYSVVPVNDPQYPTLSTILGSTFTGGRRLMRSAKLSLSSLPFIWPAAPQNLRAVLAHTPAP